MPCFINFSVTLQTEVLSTVTSDFLKQMIILKSFNSVLSRFWGYFEGEKNSIKREEKYYSQQKDILPYFSMPPGT